MKDAISISPSRNTPQNVDRMAAKANVLGQWSSPRPSQDKSQLSGSKSPLSQSWSDKYIEIAATDKHEPSEKSAMISDSLTNISSSFRIFQSDTFSMKSDGRPNSQTLDDRFDGVIAENKRRRRTSSAGSLGFSGKMVSHQNNLLIPELPKNERLDLHEERDSPSSFVTAVEFDITPSPEAPAPVSSPETSVEENKKIDGSVSPEVNYDDGFDDDDDDNDINSKVIFKERWRDKEQRIFQHSELRDYVPYHHPTDAFHELFPSRHYWKLIPIIIKSNDDLRQEQIASQIITFMSNILNDSQVPNQLKPYSILALSSDAGIIEAIPNSVSIDVLKQKELGYESFNHFFEVFFEMERNPRKYQQAQDHFIVSMANYSIICYLLHIKDRHNGNILLTTHGQIIHIDFGFILGRITNEISLSTPDAEFLSFLNRKNTWR